MIKNTNSMANIRSLKLILNLIEVKYENLEPHYKKKGGSPDSLKMFEAFLKHLKNNQKFDFFLKEQFPIILIQMYKYTAWEEFFEVIERMTQDSMLLNKAYFDAINQGIFDIRHKISDLNCSTVTWIFNKYKDHVIVKKNINIVLTTLFLKPPSDGKCANDYTSLAFDILTDDYEKLADNLGIHSSALSKKLLISALDPHKAQKIINLVLAGDFNQYLRYSKDDEIEVFKKASEDQKRKIILILITRPYSIYRGNTIGSSDSEIFQVYKNILKLIFNNLRNIDNNNQYLNEIKAIWEDFILKFSDGITHLNMNISLNIEKTFYRLKHLTLSVPN